MVQQVSRMGVSENAGHVFGLDAGPGYAKFAIGPRFAMTRWLSPERVFLEPEPARH